MWGSRRFCRTIEASGSANGTEATTGERVLIVEGMISVLDRSVLVCGLLISSLQGRPAVWVESERVFIITSVCT